MAGARSVALLVLLLGAGPLASTAVAQGRPQRQRPVQAEPTPRTERPAARERPESREQPTVRERPPAERPERRAEPREEPRRAQPDRRQGQVPKSTGEPELRRRKP